MEFAGKRFLILGGGVTGSAVAKVLEQLGAFIKIADRALISKSKAFAESSRRVQINKMNRIIRPLLLSIV